MDTLKNTAKKDFKNHSSKKNKSFREGAFNLNVSPEHQSKYYGVELNNKYVRRFKLLLRSGRTISIPYAYHPVIIFNPDTEIRIKTMNLRVTIRGRGLQRIEELLSAQMLIWLKESLNQVDEMGEVFISGIYVDGEILSKK